MRHLSKIGGIRSAKKSSCCVGRSLVEIILEAVPGFWRILPTSCRLGLSLLIPNDEGGITNQQTQVNHDISVGAVAAHGKFSTSETLRRAI